MFRHKSYRPMVTVSMKTEPATHQTVSLSLFFFLFAGREADGGKAWDVLNERVYSRTPSAPWVFSLWDWNVSPCWLFSRPLSRSLKGATESAELFEGCRSEAPETSLKMEGNLFTAVFNYWHPAIQTQMVRKISINANCSSANEPFLTDLSTEWVQVLATIWTAQLSLMEPNQVSFLTIQDFQSIFNRNAECAQPCVWFRKEYPIPLNFEQSCWSMHYTESSNNPRGSEQENHFNHKEEKGVICQRLLPCPII